MGYNFGNDYLKREDLMIEKGTIPTFILTIFDLS